MLSLSAFTSVVSSSLTLSQLAFVPVTSFAQLQPKDFCIEADYDLARALISGSYSIPDDQLEAHGVMLGTISTCSQAVIDGTKKAFASDKPVLNWLATSYYGTSNLFVSESLRGNPLSVAFRAGSALLPSVDLAIIDLLTNHSWSGAHEELMQTWFPKGISSADFSDESLEKPTFVAAVVLVGATLAIAAVQLALEDRRIARAAKHALVVLEDEFGVTESTPANRLATEGARIEAAAAAAAGARDAARAAAAAAAAAETLATEMEELAAALDAAEQKGPDARPSLTRFAALSCEGPVTAL